VEAGKQWGGGVRLRAVRHHDRNPRATVVGRGLAPKLGRKGRLAGGGLDNSAEQRRFKI
jgi:hypothetical protein